MFVVGDTSTVETCTSPDFGFIRSVVLGKISRRLFIAYSFVLGLGLMVIGRYLVTFWLLCCLSWWSIS